MVEPRSDTGEPGHESRSGRGRHALVVAYTTDLMDRSKFAASVEKRGGRLVVCRDTSAVRAALDEDDVALVLVDLERDGALELADAIGSRRCVAFASHVDTDRLATARAAGFRRVLARRALFAQLDELVAAAVTDGERER